MSDDLVSRLRQHAEWGEAGPKANDGKLLCEAAALLESQAKDLSEAKDRHQRLFDTYQAALETSATSPPTSEGIAAAINETNYKYFGDYELSQSQWGAVHCLVNAAHHYLAAKAEIERLRQEGLVKDSAIIEAAKLAKKLMTRAVQAEQEHTDMMWQRRRAEERAEKAESAFAEAVEVMRPVADVTLPWGDIGAGMILASDVQAARAFVQQHEGKK